MGAEDCAYFLKAAPGAYVFIGAGNVGKGIDEPHHSPRFQIDEDSLPIAAATVAASAVRMLQ
jgi:amidohydrolase